MQAQGIGMAQTALTIGLPTIAVMIGILVNNSRLGDLNGRIGDLNGRITTFEHHVDARFDDLKATWRAELQRVEEVLDARLRHLEDRS